MDNLVKDVQCYELFGGIAHFFPIVPLDVIGLALYLLNSYAIYTDKVIEVFHWFSVNVFR